MKLSTSTLTKLVIADAPGLDPIHVYAEDQGAGQGSLLVRCWDRAWYAYWGGMGKQPDGSATTVRQFVMWAGSDYTANCLIRGTRACITKQDVERRDMAYLIRIVEAIKRAFEAQQPRVTKQRAARLERLRHVNTLIEVISRHGRRFFWNDQAKRVARMEMDARGKLWWVDDYQGKRICIEKMGGYEHDWRGFSHGGTLKDLVQMMRNYVKTGYQIHSGYIAVSYWGYPEDAAEACRAEAKMLPIIR